MSAIKKIDEIYRVVSNSGTENFITKYSAIIVGVIAFIGVVAQLWIAYTTNIHNQDFQKEWEQKKIDVDLIAKSRLKWIEDVRSLAAEFINDLLNLQYLNEIDYIRIASLRKKAELLKLYFSSVSYSNNTNISIEEIKKKLSNNESNENKNLYVKKYIDYLVSLFSDEDHIAKRKNIITMEKAKKGLLHELFELEEDADFITIWHDEAKEEITYPTTRKIPEKHNDLANQIWQQFEERKRVMEKNKKEINGYDNDLSYFREVLSIYLKIEWDRAKEAQ